MSYHSQLSDKPQYEALSYVWGYPHLFGTIEGDGRACVVHKNVYQALEHLRAKHRERLLWVVDARCIN